MLTTEELWVLCLCMMLLGTPHLRMLKGGWGSWGITQIPTLWSCSLVTNRIFVILWQSQLRMASHLQRGSPSTSWKPLHWKQQMWTMHLLKFLLRYTELLARKPWKLVMMELLQLFPAKGRKLMLVKMSQLWRELDAAQTRVLNWIWLCWMGCGWFVLLHLFLYTPPWLCKIFSKLPTLGDRLIVFTYYFYFFTWDYLHY